MLTWLLLAGNGSTLAGTVLWDDSVRVGPGAWARMTRWTNGSWRLVHTIFPRGQPSRLRILQSTNPAGAWFPLSELAEPGRQLDNGNLLTLPGGLLLLTGRSLIEGESYRLPVYASTNGGCGWARLGDIDSNEGASGSLKGRGLWEPHLALLSDGRVAAFYSSEKHDGFSQIVAQKVSDDRGRTWGPEIRAVAQPGGGALRPGMPVLARLADGRFILVYEVVGLGRGLVHCKRSVDGVNWSQGLGTAIPGHEAGPFVMAAEDGRLLVTSCANLISVSDDAGDSWTRLDPPAFALGFRYSWPALYPLCPGEVVLTVTADGIRLRSGRLPASPVRF